MDKNKKVVSIPQSDQGKAPALHVQTGVRAGGFYDRFYAWWEGVADGFNAFDRATGGG